jgi:hypothetical protein
MAKTGGLQNEHATDAEIEAAIRALSPADALRLQRVATFRARALAGLGLGQGGDDLLQEAITRTVAGSRRWRKDVPFVKHLIETMRSIASHAREELHEARFVSTTSDAAQQSPGPICKTDAERLSAAREKLEQISARFHDDDAVGLVLEGMADGMTGPDIQRDLKITPQHYETIVLRLRRGINRKDGWVP